MTDSHTLTISSGFESKPHKLQPENQVSVWAVILLLIISATAAQAGRIFNTRSTTGELPFHSANDRSRWITLVSLVEQGTYEVDEVIARVDPNTKRKTWYSIDLVRHRGWDGKQHYFSSKPPLLTTIYAGVYWLLFKCTGWTLSAQPFLVARILLVLFNLVPVIIYWSVFVSVLRRFTANAWAQVIAVAAVTWGTYPITFTNTLNNHLPGTIAASLILLFLIKIFYEDDRRIRWPLLLGLTGMFLVACELPGLAWFAGAGALLILSPKRWRDLALFTAGAAPVLAGIAITNYLAHGDLQPPYAHRDAGTLIATVPKLEGQTSPETSAESFAKSLASLGENVDSAHLAFREGRQEKTWELMDETNQVAWAIVDSSPGSWEIRQWNDWYDYPKSYWLPGKKAGVDKGEPSSLVYAFHVLIGHHGILTLTPIWIIALLGTMPLVRTAPKLTPIIAMIVAVSAVCVTFYLLRPLDDRNYGGVCSGFRWVIWMTPLWLLFFAPGLEKLQNSATGRTLSYIAIGVSIFSATFAWPNPWTQPWLFQLLEMMQWISYK